MSSTLNLYHSAFVTLLGLHGLELVLSDKIEFGFHREKELLVSCLFFLFFLNFDLLSLLPRCLLECLLDLNLLLLLLPLFSHGHSLFLYVVALDDFIVPEIANFPLFVLLGCA